MRRGNAQQVSTLHIAAASSATTAMVGGQHTGTHRHRRMKLDKRRTRAKQIPAAAPPHIAMIYVGRMDTCAV
jgi:hypothetical protein